MTSTSITPSPEAFVAKFVENYENKKQKNNDHEWKQIWENTNIWSSFMLYDDNSVVRKIAESFNLVCYRGEPLHVDAVFTRTKEWDWFPITVALEHENNYKSLHGEIKKLISIRCDLKVVVTYSLIELENDNIEIGIHRLNNAKSIIEIKIKEAFAQIGNSLGTPEESYLFIIGHETLPRNIEWHYTIIRPDTDSTKPLNWIQHS